MSDKLKQIKFRQTDVPGKEVDFPVVSIKKVFEFVFADDLSQR